MSRPLPAPMSSTRCPPTRDRIGSAHSEPRLEIRVSGGRLVSHEVAGLDPVGIDPQGEQSGHVAPLPSPMSRTRCPGLKTNGKRADPPDEAASQPGAITAAQVRDPVQSLARAAPR